MKTNKNFGLVIGRFQPPCLHHLEFIKEVTQSGISKLLIGVGDSSIVDDQNFLTAAQVKDLLTPNLDQLNFPYQIKIIPDIHNPPKYAQHVITFFPQINQSNTCLFTDNNYLSDCFTNYGHNFEHQIQTILPHRAATIRQMIIKNDPTWQSFTPKNVKDFISKITPNL
jgi:nicotinamide mononucleotide adenylyltransferase